MSIAPSTQVRITTNGMSVWPQLLDARGFDRIDARTGTAIALQAGYAELWDRDSDHLRQDRGVAAGLYPAAWPAAVATGIVDLDNATPDAVHGVLSDVDRAVRASAPITTGSLRVRRGTDVTWQPWPDTREHTATTLWDLLLDGMTPRPRPLTGILEAATAPYLADGWRVTGFGASDLIRRQLLAENGYGHLADEYFQLEAAPPAPPSDDAGRKTLVAVAGMSAVWDVRATDDEDFVSILLRKGGYGNAEFNYHLLAVITANPAVADRPWDQDAYARLRGERVPLDIAANILLLQDTPQGRASGART